MKELISKENYISKAYEILTTDGVGAITIRRLADELKCNSANLYRYFDGLDELILYASLKYLKSYLSEVRPLLSSPGSSLDLHFTVWECFARHTYSYPEIFNNLFWGKYSHQLDRIIQDYYTIFPEELTGMDDYMMGVFLSGDFDYRDYLMVMRSVEEGLFTEQQAAFLNTVTMNLYRGFFKDLLDHPENRDSEKAKNSFLECIKKIFAMQLASPEV